MDGGDRAGEFRRRRCRTYHATLCNAAREGPGLGYELLREAVNALRMHGARRISLTVTSANAEAIKLYQRCGFRDARRFLSYVWEGY